MEIIGQTVGSWTGFIGAFFILLHIPSCNQHWVHRLKPFSDFLKEYHDETLLMATVFAIIHIILDLIGLTFNIWI